MVTSIWEEEHDGHLLALVKKYENKGKKPAWTAIASFLNSESFALLERSIHFHINSTQLNTFVWHSSLSTTMLRSKDLECFTFTVTGTSALKRYTNHLDPSKIRGALTQFEIETIVRIQSLVVKANTNNIHST